MFYVPGSLLSMHISEPTESYQSYEQSIDFISSFQLYKAEAQKRLNKSVSKTAEQVSGKALLAPEHIFWPPGGTTSELQNQQEGYQRGGNTYLCLKVSEGINLVHWYSFRRSGSRLRTATLAL